MIIARLKTFSPPPLFQYERNLLGDEMTRLSKWPW